jgi:hypothetical protein
VSEPPENAKGGPLSETAQRKTLAREFADASNVKASCREGNKEVSK